MRYVPEILNKYGLKVYQDSSHALIHSYAKDAETPIVFIHDKHKHSVPYQIEYPANTMNFCILYFFMSGKFGFIFDDITYMPAYGDVIIIPENTEKRSRFFSTTDVDYYEIVIPLELFNKINIINPFTKVFHGKYSSRKNVLTLSGANREFVFSHLKKIEQLIYAESFNDFIAYSYLIQIMDIIASSQDNGVASSQPTILPPKLQSAIDYIHRNFSTLSGVDEVSSKLGITKTYLARLFKKFNFGTPNEYINEVRISHAKYLLSNEYSPTYACYNSGFTNYSYFVTRFKKIAGTTPSKFIKPVKKG